MRAIQGCEKFKSNQFSLIDWFQVLFSFRSSYFGTSRPAKPCIRRRIHKTIGSGAGTIYQAVTSGNARFFVAFDKNGFRHRHLLPMKKMIDLPGGAGHLMSRFRIKIMATMDRLP